MAKDPTAFRERFKAYKDGKSVKEIYDGGLPRYAEGTHDFSDEEAMEYILQLENPHRIGYSKGIWRTPKDSSKYDVHQIGGGLDIREEHNPIVYNYLKSKGRLNNPWLTEAEEKALRMQTWKGKKANMDKFVAKYGDKLSLLGYNTAAGMLWHGHPFKMMNTADSITGKALANAMASGDKDLDSVFDTYYGYGTNAKRFASRIDANTKYRKAYKPTVIAPRTELIEQLDNTPKFQPWSNYHGTDHPINNPAPSSISSWNSPQSPAYTPVEYNARLSYLRLPDIKDVIELSIMMPKFKNGKLPGYQDGTNGKPKGDGTRYLWDDQTQSWDRYTGDAMGDTFADFVVTPRGGAHKKDIEPVLIVTPEQQQYSQRNKPTVSTNSTWHPTPAASTFAGRIVQAAGGDWKSADIASAGASLHPLLSVPIGVMDTGYNLNLSIHNVSDTDQHVNTALSAASILPLVGGIKLLKGKDFGTKLLNSYNNYMYSLGNVDDINKTLRGIKYTDSAYDALPAMDDMFRDVAKDPYVKDQLKQYFARGVLSRPASAKGADIFTMKSSDQVYQGITDMQVPNDVRDIFYNSVLPRILSYRPGYHGGILKPTVKSHVDQTLLRGYTTYPEKVFEDAGLKLFSGFEYPDGHIAVKDTDVDFALGHELRHRLDGTLNLTQGEQDLLDATFTQDFDNLPDFVETLRGVNMAPEKVTTNYDARLQLLGDYKLKNFSIEALNKIIDAVSDDKIVNAIKNSNGYGRNYINFLVQQYGHVPSEIIKAARESMKRVGAVAGFGFLGAAALKPRQK